MDSKEEIFNRFFDLLCEKFGGSTKMCKRFDQLCVEAGEKFRATRFSRLNRVELLILFEAFEKPATAPGRQTIDQLLDQAEYQEEI